MQFLLERWHFYIIEKRQESTCSSWWEGLGFWRIFCDLSSILHRGTWFMLIILFWSKYSQKKRLILNSLFADLHIIRCETLWNTTSTFKKRKFIGWDGEAHRIFNISPAMFLAWINVLKQHVKQQHQQNYIPYVSQRHEWMQSLGIRASHCAWMFIEVKTLDRHDVCGIILEPQVTLWWATCATFADTGFNLLQGKQQSL